MLLIISMCIINLFCMSVAIVGFFELQLYEIFQSHILYNDQIKYIVLMVAVFFGLSMYFQLKKKDKDTAFICLCTCFCIQLMIIGLLK